MHDAIQGPLKCAVSAQKAFQWFETEIAARNGREKYLILKKVTEKIELVA